METNTKRKMTPAMSAAADENALLLESLNKVTQNLLTTQQALTATKTELSTTKDDLFHTADQLIQAKDSVSLLQTEVNDLRAEKLIAITTASNTKNNKRGKKQQQQQQQQQQEKDSKLVAFQKWHNAIKPPSTLRARLKQRSPNDKDALIRKLQRELASKESRLNIQRNQLNELRKGLAKEKEYSALLHREGSRLLTQKCELEQTLNETLVENRALKDKNKYWVENRALKKENRVLRRRNRAFKEKNQVLRDLLGDGILVTNWHRLGKDRREQYRDWKEKVDGLLEGAGDGNEQEDGDGDEVDDESEVKCEFEDGDAGVNLDHEAYGDVQMDEDEFGNGEGFLKMNEDRGLDGDGNGYEEGEYLVEEDGGEKVEELIEVQVLERAEQQGEEGANQVEDQVEPKDEDADGEEGGCDRDDGGQHGSEDGNDATGCEGEDWRNNGDGKENGDEHGKKDQDEGERNKDDPTKADEAEYSASRLEPST